MKKLVEDQGVDSSETLASLSDDEIAAIHDVIRKSSGLMCRRMPDRGNHISILAVKNLELLCLHSKPCDIAQGLTMSTVPTRRVPFNNSINGNWNKE